MAIQQRSRNGKPSCGACAGPLSAAVAGFSPGIRCAQMPFPQMAVDSTEGPITVLSVKFVSLGKSKKEEALE
ncbi:MAG: hypothetical protein EOS78_04600 [Mesorhizobium sp.]|nr:MAG: hypothetical protein EOS78_04600 [Mesorhizobium sp.]